jgi:transglutaminase-like putative cysteine protease
MIAPPGMLAASTLLWGWLCGAWIAAVPIAFLLEAWRWTGARWNLSAKDFQRVADFCTWVFVLEAGYFTVAKGWPLPILLILQWLPVVLAPLIIAQLYSSAGRVELSALFLSLRTEDAGALAQKPVDLSFAYAAVCVLAAGAANVRTHWYFLAAAALALWALWGARSRRYPVWLWCGLVALAVVAGYSGHQGLNRLQTWIFNAAIEYFQLDLARTDPYRASTDIGHIGELKSSDRIILRVTVPPEAPVPLLLHRASYDLYVAATWFARGARFAELAPDASSGKWLLESTSEARFSVTVSEILPSGIGVLSLPEAVISVSGLGAASVQRNRFGAVRVEREPGSVSYTAASGSSAQALDVPSANDLRVPAQEADVLQRIAGELRLSALAPEQAAAELKRFFAERFRYTTYQARRVGTENAIGEFLRNSRAGHCEYFATATVLLARAAGIPARYATGYSVQEFSAIERRYIVRERHAHAWARLFLNGAWRDVDTTPTQWFAAEARDASLWEPLTDIGSWLEFRFAQWRASPAGRETSLWWYVLLAALFATLMWRLYRGGGFTRARRSDKAPAADCSRSGFDSAFYAIESRIAETGLPRLGTETHAEWVERIAPRFAQIDRAALNELLRLHYRVRFDPQEMSAVERQMFAHVAGSWLAKDPRPLGSDAGASVRSSV